MGVSPPTLAAVTVSAVYTPLSSSFSLSKVFLAFTDTSPPAYTVPAISAVALVSAMPTAAAIDSVLPQLDALEPKVRTDVASMDVFPWLVKVAPLPTLADTSLCSSAQDTSKDTPAILLSSKLKSLSFRFTVLVPLAFIEISLTAYTLLLSTLTWDFTFPIPTLNPMPIRLRLYGIIDELASEAMVTLPWGRSFPSVPV